MARSKDFELALRVRAEMKDAVKRLNGLERELYQAGDAADRADKQTSAFSRAVGKMGDKAKSSGLHLNKLAIAAGAAFAVAGVSRFVHYLVQSNEQLYQMSQQAKGLNVSVKFLAGMEQQADDLGVKLTNLSVVFGTLNRQIAGAKRGSATSQEYLASFGVDYRRVNSTSEAFLQIADNVKQYGLNAERSGQLLTLLSASGKQIVPILEQGGAAIRAQNDAMAQTGQIITDQSLPQIIALHNATDAIGDSFTALRNNLILELGPSLVHMADTFENAMESFAQALDDPQIQQGIQSLVEGLGEIVTWSVKVAANMGAALDGIKAFSEYLVANDSGFVSGTVTQQQARQAAVLKNRAAMVSGYNRYANTLHLGFIPGVQHNGQDALDYVNTIARRSANATIDTSLSQAEQQRQFQVLAALKRSNDAFIKTYADSSDTLIQKMVTTTRAANLVLAQTLSSAQGRQKRAQIFQGSGALDVGSGLAGNTAKPPSPPNPANGNAAAAAAARAKAIQIAQEAAAANTQLRNTFIQLQAARDPAAAAAAKYNQTMARATAAAEKAKQATNANVAAIDGYVAGIEKAAAGTRDATLADIAHQHVLKQMQTLQQHAQTILADQGRQEQQIQAEQQAGLISQYTARQRIVQLHERTAAALDKVLVKLRQLAVASGDPRAIANVKNLAAQVRLLKIETNDVKQAFETGFTGGVEQALMGLADRTLTVSEAFKTLGRSVARSLAQVAARALAAKAMGAISGLFGGGDTADVSAGATKLTAASAVLGGASILLGTNAAKLQAAADTMLVASAAGIAAGFAGGGYTGVGGVTDVAGVVHAGEYVQPARVVGQPGALDFMRAFHRQGMAALAGYVPGYARGGLVASPADFAGVAPPRISMPALPRMHLPDAGSHGASGPAVGVRIINAIDEDYVTDKMAGDAGETVIKNVIRENATLIKQVANS